MLKLKSGARGLNRGVGLVKSKIRGLVVCKGEEAGRVASSGVVSSQRIERQGDPVTNSRVLVSGRKKLCSNPLLSLLSSLQVVVWSS